MPVYILPGERRRLGGEEEVHLKIGGKSALPESLREVRAPACKTSNYSGSKPKTAKISCPEFDE